MSSRDGIPSKRPGHRVDIGWDNPLMTFFAQVERTQGLPDPDESIVLWLGNTTRQYQTAEAMAPALAPYADLTPSILEQLRQDRAADLDRETTPLQRRLNDVLERDVAGYETIAVPVRHPLNPTVKPERTMSDNTQAGPQPQGPLNTVQSQEQPTANGPTPVAGERAQDTTTQPENQGPQNLPRQPDDEMRQLLQDLAQTSAALGPGHMRLQSAIARLGVSSEENPKVLQGESFRREVAYAVQDLERATGRQLFPNGDLRTEMQRLATTVPGLNDGKVVRVLEATPTIKDQSFVSEIREVARDFAAAGERQSMPQSTWMQIANALENRALAYSAPPANPASAPTVRPAPAAPVTQRQADPTNDAAPMPVPSAEVAQGAAPRNETLNTALQRHSQQQGGKPRPEPPPGESTAEKWTRALRAPIPTGAEVIWPLPAQSITERISMFEKRLAEGKTHRLLQDAEKSGRQAIESTEQFIQGPGRGILGKMESAASTEPGGMQTVLREMQPGGRYANLRTEFDNAYQQDQIFRGAYDKMVENNTRFGKDRDAITNNYTLRNLDPAELDGRFQRAEESLGETLSKVPGKEPGKSALDEMAEKLAEVLRAAVDRIKGMFRPGADAEARQQSRPAPSMSP